MPNLGIDLWKNINRKNNIEFNMSNSKKEESFIVKKHLLIVIQLAKSFNFS